MPLVYACEVRDFKGRTMPARLFVGNLSYDVTESDLKDFFSAVGPLSNVIIPVDRDTGKPRGFAFIEFSDQAQAEEASRRLNNQPLKGRSVTINEARARESRSGPGGGPRPAGAAGDPGFTPRLPAENPEVGMNPMEGAWGGRAERRSRNFESDTKPSRKRKQRQGAKSESRGRKGPIRERAGGQFFGNIDDDDDDDDYEDESEYKYRW